MIDNTNLTYRARPTSKNHLTNTTQLNSHTRRTRRGNNNILASSTITNQQHINRVMRHLPVQRKRPHRPVKNRVNTTNNGCLMTPNRLNSNSTATRVTRNSIHRRLVLQVVLRRLSLLKRIGNGVNFRRIRKLNSPCNLWPFSHCNIRKILSYHHRNFIHTQVNTNNILQPIFQNSANRRFLRQHVRLRQHPIDRPTIGNKNMRTRKLRDKTKDGQHINVVYLNTTMRHRRHPLRINGHTDTKRHLNRNDNRNLLRL